MGDEDDLTISIGAREIYDAVVACRTGIEALHNDHAGLVTRVTRLERDVASLQRVRWQAAGALALAAGAAAYVIPHL